VTNSTGRRDGTNWERGSETAIGIRIALRWAAGLLALVGGVLQVFEGLDGRGVIKAGIFLVLAVCWIISAAPATQRWLRRRHRKTESR
jgi:hypothetical protein